MSVGVHISGVDERIRRVKEQIISSLFLACVFRLRLQSYCLLLINSKERFCVTQLN